MGPGERLRLGASLAHAVPGVALHLRRADGAVVTVARHRLDADLDPCQLRTLLLSPPRSDRCRLLDSVVAVDVVAGLVDIGGGLYQRCGPGGEDERWFATFVPERRATELFSGCPVERPDGAVRAVLEPDVELGVMVVQLWSADAALGTGLDEVASWAVATCMVEELVGSIGARAPQ